jgi:hypothetical protein
MTSFRAGDLIIVFDFIEDDGGYSICNILYSKSRYQILDELKDFIFGGAKAIIFGK